MRFLVEAEVTGGLEHPGIVPVYGLGRYPDGRPYYAMRLIRGESLKEAIARHHRVDPEPVEANGRALAFRKLLRRFLGVCDVIDYAHSRGILHRDLKPSNIMLGPHGETLVVDWGLAKRVDVPDAVGGGSPRPLLPSTDGCDLVTIPGSVVGTPHYMSPEQAEGDPRRIGPDSDIYSLGATLYCLMTGRSPFEDDRSGDVEEILRRVKAGDFPPPRSVNPTIAAGLEAVCLKAMALRPEARHASARELADEVERWLAEEPVSAYREAVARYEALVGQDPGRPNYREGLARSRSDLALALHVLGRGAEAAELQRGAIDEYRALVRDHPRVTGYRDGLAGGYSNLGRILMAIGREAEAKDAYRSAFAEYERLVRATPRALDYRTNLGDLMISLGRSADDVQKTLGRLSEPEGPTDRATEPQDLPPPPLPRMSPTARELADVLDPEDSGATGPEDPLATRDERADEPEDSWVTTADGVRSEDPIRANAAGIEFGFRYEVRRLVGRGGLGNVWLVHDRELHRDVVLKELLTDRPEARRWFLLEAQITAQLTHPSIVPVYDLGRSQSDRPYYTMKFVSGDTLLELVRRLHESWPDREAPDPHELRHALDSFLRACEAIEYAHSRGVLHRDIKPSNILIGKFGEVFVSDWGLAKVGGKGIRGSGDGPLIEPSDSLTTVTGSIIGTPAYMSPEQVMGDLSRVDFRSDIYALGATLFHILTGRSPHHVAGGIHQIFAEIASGMVPRAAENDPWVPSALDLICARAMAFSPEDRYPTPRLLAEDLHSWLAGESDPWYRRLARRGFGRRPGPLAP